MAAPALCDYCRTYSMTAFGVFRWSFVTVTSESRDLDMSLKSRVSCLLFLTAQEAEIAPQEV